MNIKMVFKVIGRLLIFVALLMLLPAAVGLYYREEWDIIGAFLLSAGLGLGVGALLNLQKVPIRSFFTREGLVIVSLSWLLISFLGGLPLYLSGQYPTLVDAFFEISSGFTTTGATVAVNVEGLPKAILFWRSLTQMIGGMGVLVFVLAVMPQMKEDSIYLMKAEVPGPVFGKVVSKLGDTARILYKIYIAMTVVLTLALCAAGMPLFDSINHAMATAGTGGFGIKNASIGHYDSAAVDIIIGIGMLAFGINFNLYYLILIGKVKEFFKSEELKWYAIIVTAAVALITLNLFLVSPLPFGDMLRHVFFAVSSVITTTGFATVDFDKWPLFSHVVLLILMFIGSCAGSTAGGIKIARVVPTIKSAIAELRRSRNPKRILVIQFEGKVVDTELIKSLGNYLLLYTMVFAVLLLIVALDSPDFETAFSAVAATFNNVGPGFGVVGPTGSFAGFSAFSKLALSFGMIAGRLEILPMLILFSANTWKRT